MAHISGEALVELPSGELVTKEKSRMRRHRDSYNGGFISSVVVPTRKKLAGTRRKGTIKQQQSAESSTPILNDLLPEQSELPDPKYEHKIPVTTEKFQNLQDLKGFCSVEVQPYYLSKLTF